MKVKILLLSLFIGLLGNAQNQNLELSAHFHQLYPPYYAIVDSVHFDSLDIDEELWRCYFDMEGDDVLQPLSWILIEDLFYFTEYHMGFYFSLAINEEKLKKKELLSFAKKAGYWQVWSEDSLILNLLFEESHGGTYSSSISHVFVFEEQEISQFYIDPMWEEEYRDNQDKHALMPDGYSSFQLLPDGNYLASGAVRGCSTCFGSYAEVWRVTDKIEILWSQSYFGRDYEAGFEYFADSSLLKISYVTDDLQPICSCEGEQESEYDFDWEQLRECTCFYEYRSGVFELLKSKDLPFSEGSK